MQNVKYIKESNNNAYNWSGMMQEYKIEIFTPEEKEENRKFLKKLYEKYYGNKSGSAD